MADIYESVVQKYRGSPSALILFVLSVIMLGLGINHFIEDTYSSKIGLENLEATFNLNLQIFQWSYWTMSLAPQIASMVFGYIYLSDTHRKWALYVALASQIADFMADSWYRSNGQLFVDGGVTSVSMILTFVYFSVGSEIFVTIGGGLVIRLAAPAILAFRDAAMGIQRASRPYERPRHPNQDKKEHFFDSNQVKVNKSKNFERLPKYRQFDRDSEE